MIRPLTFPPRTGPREAAALPVRFLVPHCGPVSDPPLHSLASFMTEEPFFLCLSPTHTSVSELSLLGPFPPSQAQAGGGWGPEWGQVDRLPILPLCQGMETTLMVFFNYFAPNKPTPVLHQPSVLQRPLQASKLGFPFLWVFPNVGPPASPSTLVSLPSFRRSCLLLPPPPQLQELVCHVMMGNLVMFRKDSVLNILSK